MVDCVVELVGKGVMSEAVEETSAEVGSVVLMMPSVIENVEYEELDGLGGSNLVLSVGCRTSCSLDTPTMKLEALCNRTSEGVTTSVSIYLIGDAGKGLVRVRLK